MNLRKLCDSSNLDKAKLQYFKDVFKSRASILRWLTGVLNHYATGSAYYKFYNVGYDPYTYVMGIDDLPKFADPFKHDNYKKAFKYAFDKLKINSSDKYAKVSFHEALDINMHIVVGSAEKIAGAEGDNWDFPIAYVAKIASEGFDLDDVPFMLRSVKTSIPYFVDEHKLEPQSEYSGSLKEALKIAAEA